MNKIKDKKYIAALTWLCSLVYLVSYLTRKNFGAVISEYIVAEGLTKSAASPITVAMFVCYGAGQLVSGWLGDHIKPRYIIFGGLIASSVFNVAVPIFGSSVATLTVIWGLNGFAQAMMWPPMVKILTDYFTEETYNTSCVKVSWGSSIGTIVIYLVASAFIKLFGSWRTVFIFSAVCGIAMAAVWYIASAKIERYAAEHGEPQCVVKAGSTELNAPAEATPIGTLFKLSPIMLIMLAIIFQGMLRDGVEVWMPSYMHDIFALDTSSSILTSIGLPIFSILCFQLVSFIYNKKFKNELTCAAVIFLFGVVSALLLGVFYKASVALSILLVMAVVGAMHGVNLMLVCIVPGCYSKYGNVSFISGLLNTCTYVGSAIFTYGIAKLADLFDWQVTIFSWAVVALVGALCCVLAIRPWRRFKR